MNPIARYTSWVLLFWVGAWSISTSASARTPTEAPAEVAISGIRFRVTGLQNDRGTLACGLFDAEGWLRSGKSGEGGQIEEGVAICSFDDVEPGVYGISAYHDQNGNGKLDSNFLRIPKEGTTASRNARGRMGPPNFEDAKFEYSGGPLELEATMQYR